KPGVEFLDVEKRIHRLEFVGGGIELGTAYVGGGVNDLALQVRVVHDVEIHDAERADAGCAKIERQRRPEASRADAQHFRSLELELPFHADLGHDQVARVAEDLVVVEGERSDFG